MIHTRAALFAAVAIVVGVFNGTLFAQGSILAELYGQGVHDFYSGRYVEAHEALSMAIEQGSADPRCYYFRGLCLARLGRPDEAQEDFQQGAQLEVTGRDRIYPVGESLQRIQGAQRLQLEEFRRSARVAAQIEARKVQQARYEEMQRAESRVLRDPNRKPAAEAESLVGPAPTDPSDPFNQGEPQPEVAPPRETAIDTAEVTKSAESAAPSAAAPATPPPAAVNTDPFGNPAPSPENPFGSPPPAADDNPFGTPPPATDNPFGTPPASADDDPFGAPANPAAGDDDPFGNPFGN